jgi:hypothetical protein
MGTELWQPATECFKVGNKRLPLGAKAISKTDKSLAHQYERKEHQHPAMLWSKYWYSIPLANEHISTTCSAKDMNYPLPL